VVWALSICGGLVALLLLFLVWGLLHLRQSQRQAHDEIRRIELADIGPLARECVEVFRNKLGVRLDLDNCDDAAEKLDHALRDHYKVKRAFARDDFYWYFVKPVGACLGELLRRHARHEWHKRPGEAPHMEFAWGVNSSEAFPFEKVIKQSQVGDAGDLVAYVEFARTVERVEDEPEPE
jgi:hypothetical protein